MRTHRIAGLLIAAALTAQLALALTPGAAPSETAAASTTAGVGEAGAARPAAQEQGDEFRWSGRLAAGRVIEVKGVNGRVNAEGTAAGGEVEVVARKSARRSDTSSVRIELVVHADGVTVSPPRGSRGRGRSAGG